MEVCTCGREAGAGLDVVGTGLAHDVAHLFLFFLGQQAGLNDDLQNLIAHSLLHGTDVLADSIVLLVLQAADVDDHVHLGCAVGDGSLGFKQVLMQTDAVWFAMASSHSCWIWGQVASGFSRV